MKTPVVIACALLMSGGSLPAAEEIPFYVHLVPSEAKTARTVGIPASDLAVVIRNDTSDKAAGVIPPRALVLRGVEWVGGRADARRWLGPVIGSVTENPDHTLTLNPNVARLSALSLEHGLLLPGDEITVNLPITLQGEEPPVLKIRYAWAGDSLQWREGMLLPVAGEGGTTQFLPATSAQEEARHNRGGLGALRATLSPASAALPEQTFTLPVTLPLAPATDYASTGGISIVEAAEKAGVDDARGPWRGSYSAALQTWFFTAADGSAVALERVPVENPPLPPKAPPGFVPKPWKWTPRALPAMDLTAPDEFGRGEKGSTAMKLDAAIFGILLPVADPGSGRSATSGQTQVPADKFWAVLELAREKGLRLRLTPAISGADHFLRLEFSAPTN